MGSNGGPASDAHGTNCSGIIAAVGDNSIGVVGIAYGCKIIPFALGYESPPGSGQLFTNDTWISNCFNYAWNTAGADVISNSWGGGSVSSTITNAINTATTSGRGGNGTAVLFAAGNSNSSVQYPATLTSVISVAAMSMCNTRKTTTSCDGENFWGSNFGTGLDVGAPGVKIYSTDLTGTAGYSNTDYFSSFNGTSSACPAVGRNGIDLFCESFFDSLPRLALIWNQLVKSRWLLLRLQCFRTTQRNMDIESWLWTSGRLCSHAGSIRCNLHHPNIINSNRHHFIRCHPFMGKRRWCNWLQCTLQTYRKSFMDKYYFRDHFPSCFGSLSNHAV